MPTTAKHVKIWWILSEILLKQDNEWPEYRIPEQWSQTNTDRS
jgi:hypothetical protein